MFQQRYYVTTAPESAGVHFVHSESCQVLPDQDLEDLGTFDDCGGAFDRARERYRPVNACALCCSDCYVKGAS